MPQSDIIVPRSVVLVRVISSASYPLKDQRVAFLNRRCHANKSLVSLGRWIQPRRRRNFLANELNRTPDKIVIKFPQPN